MQSLPYPNDSSNMQTHDTKPPDDQPLGLPDTVTREKSHDLYQYVPTQSPINRFQSAVSNEMTIPVQAHPTHPICRKCILHFVLQCVVQLPFTIFFKQTLNGLNSILDIITR
jgi:hypothetical protein